MSFGRQSPSSCVPHHDEYAHITESPRRSLLSRYDELRPTSVHDGMHSGKVAARVRSLNAALSSSVPALVLPEDEFQDAKSGISSHRSQEDIRKSVENPETLAQNLYPLRKKASFRARRQGTLIRTRSNPFVRRDSSAASPSPPPCVARSRSRDAPIHSPSPLRMLPLESLKLDEDDFGVSESELLAAGKGSAKWANLLWNVWAGMKTTLPRQAFVDAVNSQMRDQREVEIRKEQRMRREAGEDSDDMTKASTDHNGLRRCEDTTISERVVRRSSKPMETDLHSEHYGGHPGRLQLQLDANYTTSERSVDLSARTPDQALFQNPTANSRMNKAILSSQNTTSIRSTSPWPDFDDVGYAPSENNEISSQSSCASSPLRHTIPYYSNCPQDQTIPQSVTGEYNTRPSKPRKHPPSLPPESSSSNRSTGNNNGNEPGTAIAIRLGDMFDAIIIARGAKPLPAPEITHITGEDQSDRMQDLQQISAGLMQRTKELLAIQQQSGTQTRSAEGEIQENNGKHRHAKYDVTQLENGLSFGHHRCHQHQRDQPDNRASRPCRGRRQFSFDGNTDDDGYDDRAQHGASNKVMSVPALLRLVDSTAKDLGLVLKAGESVAPLRVRRMRAML